MERPWGNEILLADDFRQLLGFRSDFSKVMKYFIETDPTGQAVDIF